MMQGWEIAVLVAVCAAFIAAVAVLVRNKLKGKSCCGDCSECGMCKPKKNDDRAECAECGKCPHCSGHCGGDD